MMNQSVMMMATEKPLGEVFQRGKSEALNEAESASHRGL